MAVQVGANTRVITVAGGNLFALAAQYLGDATQWNRIARLNGLRDPTLTGIVTLSIPDVNAAAGNGGLLGV
jgi:nucleoid-associated protein YgaU